MKEWELETTLQRVSWNKLVASECLKYFDKFPENIDWFVTKLQELKWRNKYVGQYRNHISLTAVPLAIKIYEQLDMIAFPFIERTTSRGWGTSGGTWAWAMEVVHHGNYVLTIGSCDSVRCCLEKKRRLSILDSGEICAEITKPLRNR